MTATTLLPAVIDYLVSAAESSSLLGNAQPVPVVVLDGPELTTDTLVEARHLWIGDDPVSGEPAASVTQDFAFLGDQGATREERGEIICAADSWSGGTEMKPNRDDCEAIIDALSVMLRGRPQTGGPGDFSLGGLVEWAQVTGPMQWYPRQKQGAAGMLCVFRITYQGRTTVT